MAQPSHPNLLVAHLLNLTLTPTPTPLSLEPQGFTDGVMIVGKYSGRKVSEAKPLIKDEMLAEGLALAYSEPEKQVGKGLGLLAVWTGSATCSSLRVF